MKVKINIAISPDVLERVDELANKLNLSRSQMMENLVSVGLEDARLFEKVGIIKAIRVLRDLRQQMDEALQLVKGGDVKVG